MNYKERPIYLEKVDDFMYKNIIKVLIGQRRIGKSVLFS
jgi:predicted AAA+ superfamily ATPase